MWNKRKEDEYPPKPPTAPPASPGVNKESHNPMSSSTAPSSMGAEGRGSAVIGKSVMIKGQIVSREDLTIDGEVEGTVELHEHRLTVGPHGKVTASVKAREIVVLGTIEGNVDVTDRIDIRKDARLVGDIKTARIVIEDGAFSKGSSDIQKPDVRPAPPPPKVAAAPAAAAAAAPSQAAPAQTK
jgi:cytoskeletal protein CcmA (bactofilin family)